MLILNDVTLYTQLCQGKKKSLNREMNSFMLLTSDHVLLTIKP